MYSLFSSPPRPLAGTIVSPRFKDVEAKILHDVSRVVDYYRYGTFFSKTDHLLVRLIHSMGVPLSYDLDKYYEVAAARALTTANSVGFTSSLSPGKWHDSVFYGGCLELIIAYSGQDNPNELVKDWRNLQAVKVVEHPVSNLGYTLPNGKMNNDEYGLAVISIDIPMLMVQYRGFVLEQYARRLEGDETILGVRDFIGKFVIPNMLHSQTDIVIFNRVFNKFYNLPQGEVIRKHPFYLSDYSELLDKGLEDIIKRITTVKMRYRDVLEHIPKVYSDYPYKMPDIAETRQVYWALFLSRLRLMTFLFDIEGEDGRHYNQASLNELKIDLKRFKSENIFNSVLPSSISENVNAELDRMFSYQ